MEKTVVITSKKAPAKKKLKNARYGQRKDAKKNVAGPDSVRYDKSTMEAITK
jgi:hypothetical protein